MGRRMFSRLILAVIVTLGVSMSPVFAQENGGEKYKNQLPVSEYLANRHLNEKVRFAVSNSLYTLYHEVGHLLVDQLEWPIMGREEDVADNFATYILLNEKRRSFEQALKDSARGWQLNDLTYGGRREAADFYDEHSLDLQRAFQIVCLMVGKDRATFAITAQDWGMARERQNRCQNDYAQIESSISRLLAPYRDVAEEADIRLTYDRPDRDMALAYKVLRDSQLLESIAEDLKLGYGLPNPITIRGTMCGEPNAFYDSREREILFCYELIDDYFYMLDQHAARDDS